MGVSVDFLSSGYLDVSVPRVRSYNPMYSGYKYLFQKAIDYRSNNSELSGGLPHSEIHGSKPILSSPWLIAEYHVFHRLLLPRHSPNALLALDLIQKKTGLTATAREAGTTRYPYPRPKAYFPAWLAPDIECSVRNTRVSVLDLDNICSFQKGIQSTGLGGALQLPAPKGTQLRCLHTRKHQTELILISL